MNVSEQIIKVLDYLCEKVGLAIDWASVFASENVIPYVEQLCDKYITYEIATSVIWLIFGIIFLFIGKLAIKNSVYCGKKYRETEKFNDWDGAQMLAVIIAVSMIVIGVIVSMTQIFEITTCVTFPEKVIVEELMSIYDSMN